MGVAENTEQYPEVDGWPLIEKVWKHSLQHYAPLPLAARGLLLRSAKSIYGEKDNLDGCLGWGRHFSRGLEVTEVPGNHFSMLHEPHVWHLATAWQQALHRIKEQHVR